MERPFRIVAALMTWLTLILQYGLFIYERSSFASGTFEFFGYFTILTNCLVALAFTAPLLSQDSRLYQFFAKPAVRAAIALYILVVAVVYHILLADIHNPTGLASATNIMLHTLIPLLYLIDWWLFASKRPMFYGHIPYWIIYPMVYGLLTVAKGALTGNYVYPFLNATELGWDGAFLNMVGFTIMYAIGAAGFIALGRALSRKA